MMVIDPPYGNVEPMILIAHMITGMRFVHVTVPAPIKRPARPQFCTEEVSLAHGSLDSSETEYQTVFDPRPNPTSPRTVAVAPPTNSQIDLSVAEPLKNREKSELVELYALIPKIRRRMPPASTASEIALFMGNTSFCDILKLAPAT
jgi:hypothetical protein